MTESRTYRITEAARLAGITVRTLHHYDAIGLLVPRRTAAGYRLYSVRDLLRLQQIVIQRSLGFSLEQIRRWLDDPEFDHERALMHQRAVLLEDVHERFAKTLDAEHAGLAVFLAAAIRLNAERAVGAS